MCVGGRHVRFARPEASQLARLKPPLLSPGLWIVTSEPDKQERDYKVTHGTVTPAPLNRGLLFPIFRPTSDIHRSQNVVPRPRQSEKRSPVGKVGTRHPAGRRHDGPLCRVRTAHLGPVPPQRAGQSLARQVRAVLRVQLQPDREVLLQGREALLQNGLFQVTRSVEGKF